MQEINQQPQLDYSAAYFDPPRVKWWWLLLFDMLLSLVGACLPHWRLGDLVGTLLFYIWPIYFCIWLRRLDDNSMALIWVSASAVLELVSKILSTLVDSDNVWAWLPLNLIGVVVLLVGTFGIRSELQRHYNQREDFSLKLGPFMTFFFSFLYFQYHLYDIAEARQQERQRFTTAM